MARAKKIKQRRHSILLTKQGLRCQKCGKKLEGWNDNKIYQKKYNCECCGLTCYSCQYWERNI